MLELVQIPGLLYGFSTRDDGNMAKNYGAADEVDRNRSVFLGRLGISPSSCVVMRPEHGNKVLQVDSSHAGFSVMPTNQGLNCDGLITTHSGLFLVVLTADCLPLILIEPNKRVVGLIHAGWKSTGAAIVTNAIASLCDNFGCLAANVIALLGPSIKKQSFVFFNPIQKSQPQWKPFLYDLEDGNTSIDVNGFARHQLLSSGVVESNIYESGIDTALDERFFSHYRDSRESHLDEGRYMCIVGFC